VTDLGPGTSDQDIVAGFTDAGSGAPLGLYVRQESWAFSDPADDDFILIRYVIHNRSEVELTELRAGLFVDLDFGVSSNNAAGTDLDRQLAYMNFGTDRYAGVRLLDGDDGTDPVSNVTIIENERYIYPQLYLLDADKLAFMAGSDAEHAVTEVDSLSDFSILVSAGPFTLAPGDSNEVAFAIAGGVSESELFTHVDRAQEIYTADPVSAPEATVAPGLRFVSARPNPFRRSATVRFDLDAPRDVRIDVYDVSGRHVRSIRAGMLESRSYAVSWDGRDDAGRSVAGGTYFVRLSTGIDQLTRRIVLIR
jgi:hypothetical protein